MKNSFLLALMVLFLVYPASAQTPPSNDRGDDVGVKEAVFAYFDGILNNDEQKLNRAFAIAGGHMKSIQQIHGGTDVVKSQPMAEVLEGWKKLTFDKSMTGRILSMDIVDGSLATVVFDFGGAYTDILTLAKMNGTWKIINKVFIVN